MAVSLKNIANELNLSISLVSKVLSGRMGTSGASPPIIEAIQTKARALGYQRNRIATALVTGRTGVIGVFIHRIGAEGTDIVEQMVRGITAASAEAGQRLWLSFFATDDEFRKHLPRFHSGEIDGLIVAGAAHPRLINELVQLQAGGLPVTTLYHRPLHAKLPNVGVDQNTLIRLATEHMLSRGVIRPAHIATAADRTNAFVNTVKQAGIHLDSDYIFDNTSGSYDYDVGVRAVEHWLKLQLKFDGIVAQSDQQALGAMHALMNHGISVPQQVRLIGVDNSVVCKFAYVPLSSVSEHYEKRGAQTVKLLMRQIEFGKRPRSINIKPTLFARRSTE